MGLKLEKSKESDNEEVSSQRNNVYVLLEDKRQMKTAGKGSKLPVLATLVLMQLFTPSVICKKGRQVRSRSPDQNYSVHSYSGVSPIAPSTEDF